MQNDGPGVFAAADQAPAIGAGDATPAVSLPQGPQSAACAGLPRTAARPTSRRQWLATSGSCLSSGRRLVCLPAPISWEYGGLLTAAGVRDDVAARDRCADMAGAAILIGIYLNGFPGGAGCVTDYDASRPFSAGNRMLATMLQRDLLAALNARGWGIPDGGVQPDTGMGSAITAADHAYGHLILLGPAKAGYFTTPSRMPGALIEPLFVTDPFEASLAASARGQHVIATGIAQAVDKYLASSSKRAA
jgi:hypothetical protein